MKFRVRVRPEGISCALVCVCVCGIGTQPVDTQTVVVRENTTFVRTVLKKTNRKSRAYIGVWFLFPLAVRLSAQPRASAVVTSPSPSTSDGRHNEQSHTALRSRALKRTVSLCSLKNVQMISPFRLTNAPPVPQTHTHTHINNASVGAIRFN